MGKIRYYLDEHLPKAVAQGLRRRGVDIKTCAEAQMLGASDIEQLAFAKAEGRVIATYDNDFLVLHTQGVTHSGIAFFTQPKSIGELIRELLLLYEVLDDSDMLNHIEFL